MSSNAQKQNSDTATQRPRVGVTWFLDGMSEPPSWTYWPWYWSGGC